jgi:hypothetical protein
MHAMRTWRAVLPVAVAAWFGCGKVSTVPITGGMGGVICTKSSGCCGIRTTTIDKVDLLLAIDNSQSMGDKQSELAKRIPLLLKQLMQPENTTLKGAKDLHVGVITSSLGSYGTSACDPSNPHNDDHAHLLKRPGDTLPATGWTQASATATPTPMPCPGGIADATPVSWTEGSDFANAEVATSCIVESVREDGCGYENQLESVYHFLIDPDPWQDAKVDCTFGTGGDACGANKINVTGIDNDLLAERASFLRHDSLLAIVMISDENDASLKPAQLNWLPWAYANGQMQRGWDACAKVPDDFEPDTGDDYAMLHDPAGYNCKSCFEDTGNSNCALPWATMGPNLDTDDRNLRAFEQTRRYGFNFLWGRQRYVDGFSANLVPGIDATSGAVVGKANPIFAGGFRSRDQVIVEAIVGVPIDLVTDASTGKSKELTDADWQKIISADPSVRDARMIESIAPRVGRPKYRGGGDLSADPPTSPTFGNGGDRDVANGSDLQYACVGRRQIDAPSFDCVTAADFANNPLCTPDAKQPYFKAYPGLRELRVIHDLGASGHVASICNDDYEIAMNGIIDVLTDRLNGSQCFKSILVADDDNRVDCDFVEIFPGDSYADATRCEDVAPGYCTPGAAPCRSTSDELQPTDPATAASQLDLCIDVVGPDGATAQANCPAYEQNGNVYVGGADDPLSATDGCGSTKRLVCEMVQINDDARCLNDPTYTIDPTRGGGWCYSKNPDVVGPTCIKELSPGTIRFLGGVKTKPGSVVRNYCFNHAASGVTSASVSK